MNSVDVKQLFIETLEAFDLPIYLQGSMSDDDKYPDSFFTYWNNSTADDAFYDDTETETIWDFDLNFYSNDPASVNSVLLEAKQLLKAAGFIPDGSGYDVVSDEPTHTGRGMNILYIERK
ncbi:hypothetical protein [Anaerotignum sp.]